ncbi:MAG: peptide deformylase [Cyanobacteria bacterium P01_H01_bin.15]
MRSVVLQLGHPTLRQIATPVADPTAREIKNLVKKLLLTVEADGGVGIAAPQIGESKQVIILASRPHPRYPDAPYMDPIALINPEVVSVSEELVKGWEGCLSVPGLRGWVPRNQAVTVRYQTTQGETQEQTWTGFVARIFQHEYDHLQGHLFVDRVESTHDLYSEAEYQKRWAEKR